MSSNLEQAVEIGEVSAEADEVCASCGITDGDDVKLKICTACKLVKYCSIDCQKIHRPQHKGDCKKRAAEIRDDKLFKQPDERHLGECPICCLSLPIDTEKSTINSCCCKYICRGCDWANKQREAEEGLAHKCPYCREQLPEADEETRQNFMKRVKANDPVALLQMGGKHFNEGDHDEAFEYFRKAAELGDMDAHYILSCSYSDEGGDEWDLKKKIYHLEEAAIGGHPDARFNLGNHEYKGGRIDRAVKHFIIAANLGDNDSLEKVKKGFLKDL